MRDRTFVRHLIERAKKAGCSALVLTLDLQIIGQRHKDLKNGMSVPPRMTLANLIDLATKPRWAFRALNGPKTFGNLAGYINDSVGNKSNLSSLSAWIASQFDPSLNWDDVSWIKQEWGGKLILKGILDPEDAKLAVAAGADAIVVSNHGGRQLDGAISSIQALPAIVEAVGEQTEVWFDGGIRSGQDVLKACALGAKGCLSGRAFLYGLGAMGQPGVSKMLDILQKELDVSMALCGLTDIRQASKNNLVLKKS